MNVSPIERLGFFSALYFIRSEFQNTPLVLHQYFAEDAGSSKYEIPEITELL